MADIIARSLYELPDAAKEVLKQAQGRTKWMLRGDMGAGKTTFVKALCRVLHADGDVSSPTFSIVNEYEFMDADGQSRLLHHMDLYRLRDIEETLDIGIEEYLGGDSLCIIEWPELIEPLWPDDAFLIDIAAGPDGERRISTN